MRYVYLPGLRAARLDMGLDAFEVAKKTGVHHNTVFKWERLASRVPKVLVPQLAEMLGVTERSLLNHREPVSGAVQKQGRPEGSRNNPGGTTEAGRYHGRQDHIVRSHMERLHRERERVECPAPACKTKARRTSSSWPWCERHENQGVGRHERAEVLGMQRRCEV